MRGLGTGHRSAGILPASKRRITRILAKLSSRTEGRDLLRADPRDLSNYLPADR